MIFEFQQYIGQSQYIKIYHTKGPWSDRSKHHTNGSRYANGVSKDSRFFSRKIFFEKYFIKAVLISRWTRDKMFKKIQNCSSRMKSPPVTFNKRQFLFCNIQFWFFYKEIAKWNKCARIIKCCAYAWFKIALDYFVFLKIIFFCVFLIHFFGS